MRSPATAVILPSDPVRAPGQPAAEAAGTPWRRYPRSIYGRSDAASPLSKLCELGTQAWQRAPSAAAEAILHWGGERRWSQGDFFSALDFRHAEMDTGRRAGGRRDALTRRQEHMCRFLSLFLPIQSLWQPL